MVAVLMYYWTPWVTLAAMQVEPSGAQWSSVELSGAFLIVSCEQVLPLLLQHSNNSFSPSTSLGSLSSRKYETLLLHFLPRPGICSGSQVKVGDAGPAVSTDDDLRAPVSPGEVHFQDASSGLPRQSLLNCMMGCTRELRVRMRGHRTQSINNLTTSQRI